MKELLDKELIEVKLKLILFDDFNQNAYIYIKK